MEAIIIGLILLFGVPSAIMAILIVIAPEGEEINGIGFVRKQ